jgi:lysophospholipase L1-like esterase
MAVYLALGDSMSIDDYAGGPGYGAASLLHRNRDRDFPDWAGRDLAAHGMELRLLARDGATSAAVLDDQLPLIDAAPELVTLSMGGNDLLAAYGNDAAAEAAIMQVAKTGAAVLRRLRRLTGPVTPILVTTVYDPSDGSGAGTAMLPPWPAAPMLIAQLNHVLAGIAGQHGGWLADVHAHFRGHGAHTADPGQPEARPVNRDLWYCGVVEPNAWGAHEIRTCWWRTLTSGG